MSFYNVWMSLVMGDGRRNAGKIEKTGLSSREIYENRRDAELEKIFTRRQKERIKEITPRQVSRALETLEKNGIKSTFINDDDFPLRLKGHSDSPVTIYYKGDLSILSLPGIVGVVGSRHCDSEGEYIAVNFSRAFTKAGLCVVSGLAQGVDTIARKSCVDAGGKTVGVLGLPLYKYYPRTNKSFQKMLEEEHLVISEYPCETGGYRSGFVRRNRLIAMACDALCLVQAVPKSGSMSTVNKAIEYSKPVFAAPGGVTNRGFAGNNMLIARGKAGFMVAPDPVIEYFGLEVPKEEEKTDGICDDLPPEAKKVLETMESGMGIHEITRLTGLPAKKVAYVMTLLEVDGFVKKMSDGGYIKEK